MHLAVGEIAPPRCAAGRRASSAGQIAPISAARPSRVSAASRSIAALPAAPEGRLERQVLRRIADQEELGEQRDVGAGDARGRQLFARQRLVALDGPDGGIGLDGGDHQTIRHGPQPTTLTALDEPAGELGNTRGRFERARRASVSLQSSLL